MVCPLRCSFNQLSRLRSEIAVAYFLPLFLMPWPPTLRGPFAPAFLAISSRAFLSVRTFVSVDCLGGAALFQYRTGRLLELEGLVILVLLGDLLLGLLIVNGVGTRWERLSAFCANSGKVEGKTYIPFRKAFWRMCVGTSVIWMCCV